MKILFTSFAYYPQTSGVPIVVQYLAEGLARNGHDVCVATRKNGFDFPDSEIINGVEVHRFGIGQTLTKRNTGDIGEYIDFVKNWEKDILVLECIQCHTTDILLKYLPEMNCKVVIHSHGGPGIHQKFLKWETNLKYSIGNTHNWLRWKRYYGKDLLQAAPYIDAVVCLSLCASDLDYMASKMRRVEIVENAAHNLFFDESLYEKDIVESLQITNRKYILCIANYIPNKGQMAVLKAYSEINAKDCSLVFIGSKKNAYYEELQSYAESINKLKGKEVKLLTAIDRGLFPSIIHHAELFVMASEHEEYPVSLVEAMAVGTPFLSTDAGCARILPGGVTVTERKELRMALQVLIDNPELLERYGAQGKRYALDNNTTDAVVRKFETILLNVCNK